MDYAQSQKIDEKVTNRKLRRNKVEILACTAGQLLGSSDAVETYTLKVSVKMLVHFLLSLLALSCVRCGQEQNSSRTIVWNNEAAQQIQAQLRDRLLRGDNGEPRGPTCTQQLNMANITAVIQEAVASEVAAAMNTATAPEAIVNQVSAVLEQNLNSVLSQLNRPAASCQDVLNNNPNSASGNYRIATSNGSAVSMYCNMTLTCGGVTGGWTRITQLDMRESGSQCPQGLRTRSDLPICLCAINTDDPTCSSVVYPSNGIQYTQVCGRIIAFQDGTPGAFGGNFLMARNDRMLTIDDNYVDGISLTHGSNPREHIWTLAAAPDEVGSFPQSNCPCTNTNINSSSPPSFVGNNYFCDTASSRAVQFVFYRGDPLWDSAGCGPLSTCCSFNNPPWFHRQLNAATTDDIEMRLCRDEAVSNEDIPIQQIELYIQ